MLVNIPATFHEVLVELDVSMEKYRNPGDSISVDLRALGKSQFSKLKTALAADKAGVGIRRQISSWEKAQKDPTNAKPGSLNVAEAAFIDYFTTNVELGWVFRRNGPLCAAMVTGVQYSASTRDSLADLTISLKSLTVGGEMQSFHISFDGEDVKGETLVGMLWSKGWEKETPERIEAYGKSFEHFLELRDLYGCQLKITTEMLQERSYWHRDRPELELSTLGGGKVVCELKIDEEGRAVARGRTNLRVQEYLARSEKSRLFGAIKEVLPEDSTAFKEYPCTFMLPCFHLGLNEGMEVHTDNLEIYEYDDGIREKLVLPEDTMELLDTLTEELNLIQEDIVGGKTGGNVVLLTGRPGLGKTLTAEVYAEIQKAPLYMVHSGQLGINPEAIEGKLQEVYQRAARWGHCMILLDEFDVFGRERGTDLVQNAVVAVFLRTLEYQNNTIFLTTNRADDMDDAILSRCAAILNYGQPRDEELPRMWKVLRDQFLPSLSDAHVEELCRENFHLTGRDIKGVLRLAYRYERTGHEVNLALIKKCAGFRGIQNV